MIVYLDTSVFVKLIVDEPGSDEARAWFDGARLAASSVITFPETCSALCRSDRLNAPVEGRLDVWLTVLEARWRRIASLRVAERPAGRLAIQHRLRGMDAVHLGAALTLRDAARAKTPGAEVVFAAFDRRLLEAAEREGFATLGGPPA